MDRFILSWYTKSWIDRWIDSKYLPNNNHTDMVLQILVLSSSSAEIYLDGILSYVAIPFVTFFTSEDAEKLGAVFFPSALNCR